MAKETSDYLAELDDITRRYIEQGRVPKHEMMEALCILLARTVSGLHIAFDNEMFDVALDALIDAGFMPDDGLSPNIPEIALLRSMRRRDP